MTAANVLSALCDLYEPLSQTIMACNTYAAGWESDLLILTAAGYFEEIEIKVSVADFRAEFAKKKYKHLYLNGKATLPTPVHARAIRRYWFAMPEELADRVYAEVPTYAGIITVELKRARFVATKVIQPKVLPHIRKATGAEREALYRTMYRRGWEAIKKG
jgi:hypothetical protein